MEHFSIVVLNFGSQYTQIIARKLRRNGVYSEIVPHNESIEDINQELKKDYTFRWSSFCLWTSDSYHLILQSLI